MHAGQRSWGSYWYLCCSPFPRWNQGRRTAWPSPPLPGPQGQGPQNAPHWQAGPGGHLPLSLAQEPAWGSWGSSGGQGAPSRSLHGEAFRAQGPEKQEGNAQGTMQGWLGRGFWEQTGALAGEQNAQRAELHQSWAPPDTRSMAPGTATSVYRPLDSSVGTRVPTMC